MAHHNRCAALRLLQRSTLALLVKAKHSGLRTRIQLHRQCVQHSSSHPALSARQRQLDHSLLATYTATVLSHLCTALCIAAALTWLMRGQMQQCTRHQQCHKSW